MGTSTASMGNCCAWRLLLTLPENSWSLLNELLSLLAETAPLVVPWLNAERFTFPIVWLIQNTRGEERTSILPDNSGGPDSQRQ